MIIYRTPGVWGGGKGSDLDAAEVDENFYELASRLLVLEDTPPDITQISNITVTGGQFTVHMSDGSDFGPFALPVAHFQIRGDWAPSTVYATLDLVTIEEGADAGIYLVLHDHTSDTTFDPDFQVGGLPAYHFAVPPGPTGATGADGAPGTDGAPGADGKFKIDASGTYPQLADHDDEAEGFVYLATDGDGNTITTGVIFIHGDGGHADWTGPFPWQGDVGPTGPEGAGFHADYVGPFSARVVYDNTPAGTSFLSTDGDGGDITDPVIFFREVDPGDWTDGVLATGATGPSGANFTVDAFGTFVERDAHDTEAEGFSYLSTDGDGSTSTSPAVIFIKLSNSSGDWSDPIPFQGPIGPTGAAGPPGPQGANFTVDAFGTFAGRTAHDGEATGYSYLSLNGDGGIITTAVIFIKLSGATGNWSSAILFQGPKGDQGLTGAKGDTGADGPEGERGPNGYNFDPDATGTFADRSIYDSEPKDFSYLSTNGNGGSQPAASIYIKLSDTISDWSARIPFQGPKGDTGPIGPKGNTGSVGAPGVGVPVGGTTGQNLVKASNTNFATKWVDPPFVIGDESDFKESVRAATTIAVVLSGEQTVDGVALVEGDDCLVKAQAGAAAHVDNRIYVVHTGAWTVRDDNDEDAEVTSGMIVYVEEGTVNGDKIFSLTTPDPITVGVTPLKFARQVIVQQNFPVARKVIASRAIIRTDVGKLLRSISDTDVVVTVPLHATVRIPVNAEIYLNWFGLGSVSVVGELGVTINSLNGLTLPGRYSVARLKKVSVNVWNLDFPPAAVGDASDIPFEPTTGGLSSTDVQSALEELESEKADTSALGDAAFKNTGTTAGTVAAGDDSRFSSIGSPDAADVTFTPAGGLSSTDVQAALEELDTEKASTSALGDAAFKNTGTTAGTLAAGDDSRFSGIGSAAASAVTFTPAGNIASTDVQAALQELDTEKIPTSYLDTDGTLAANSDTKIATQKAIRTYFAARIAALDIMSFKGVIDCSGNPNYPAADAGDTYRISVAGKIGGASGITVEAGDMILAIADGLSSANQATVGTSWEIFQANIVGLGDAAFKNTGTTAGTLAAGDDSRFLTYATALTADTTIDITHAGAEVPVNSATDKNITVPPNASVAFAIGTVIWLEQVGVGQVVVVAGSGVTIVNDGSLKSDGQHSVLRLVKTGTNTWTLTNTERVPILYTFAAGLFTTSEVVWAQKFTDAWKLPASLTGSYATLLTAATASTTFTLKKNGSSIGTIVFAVSGTVATFTFSSAVAFAAGDVLTVTAPSSPDATAAGLHLSLKGG